MPKFSFAEIKLPIMICNTSELTLTASINQAASSLQKLSTLCFADTMRRLNITYICRMFQKATTMNTITYFSLYKSRLFIKVDSLLEAEHFKSLLLLHQSNFTSQKICG
jgi:hypothetical protein